MALTLRAVAVNLAFLGRPAVVSGVASAGLQANSDSTKSGSIVRRDTALQMGSSAEFILRHESSLQKFDQARDAVLDSAGTFSGTQQTSKNSVFDMCKFAFAYGNKDNNTCTDSDHHLIYEESMCIRAAEEGGLSTNHSTFNLPAWWFDRYPKGCFQARCDDNPKGCLFFNADGDNPEHPVGYPICTRPRFSNGTKNSKGETSDCPHGYDILTSKNDCQAAADCLGYCEGAEFDVSIPVQKNRMNYPQGCFIGTTAQTGPCVYWNPVETGNKPTHPVGIPICRAPNELVHASSTS